MRALVIIAFLSTLSGGLRSEQKSQVSVSEKGATGDSVEAALLQATGQLNGALDVQISEKASQENNKATYEKKRKEAKQVCDAWYCGSGVSWATNRIYKNKCKKKCKEEEEMEALIVQVNEEITEIGAEIERLTKAAQEKQDAAALASTEEGLIAVLEQEVTQKDQEHVLALERHASVEASLITVHEQKIVTSDEAIQQIKEELVKVQATHAKLTEEPSNSSDPHPLVTKLNEAKAAILDVIAAHDISIATISNQLADNEVKTGEIEGDANVAAATYAEAVAQLRKAREELSASSQILNEKKAAKVAELAAATQAGEAEIEALAQDLKTSIEGLKADVTKAEENKAVVITTNQQELAAVKDTHSIESNDITTQRDRLQEDKEAAVARLTELKTEHAVA